MAGPHRPEVPRTRRGHRLIQCRLFTDAHGSHHYIRGDERVCCPGRPR